MFLPETKLSPREFSRGTSRHIKVCKDRCGCRSYKEKLNQMGIFKHILSGLSSVAFPNICVCCKTETTVQERQICTFCKEERFVRANQEHELSSSGAILPDFVILQQALWEFDRGGMLQQLMHYLKYERLTGIGRELGWLLGQSLMKHPVAVDLLENNPSVLVPVPLHYLKFRKRGFNQAFFIASGIRDVTGLPICGVRSVIRKKNTHSQTGYSVARRISNVNEAFKVRQAEDFYGKIAIVVDDVFTTGATTFELSACLHRAGCEKIIIATAAQA